MTVVISPSPDHNKALDSGFLLLAHIICADQQIHTKESQALNDLANQIKANESTLQETEKILGQDISLITLEQAAQNVPLGQRSEVFRQVLAIAYIDGYFSPLERDVVNQIAGIWGIHDVEIEQMLEEAQGFSQWQTSESDTKDEHDQSLSIGAKLLKGTESLLSKSLVSMLKKLAPEYLGEKIERFEREILLSGPEYDEAIQKCAAISQEDFQYAYKALGVTYKSLRTLGNSLQQSIHNIKQKTIGKGEYKTAKEVAKQLEATRQNLSAQILHDLESVREALNAKQRSLNNFSIAFMGRTKAGKSTLHAVITGEGWESIGIGKQRTTRYNRVYDWKNIRIIDTPGIGAPGGKTDEEIARSVIEEADVICYVVTDDSIQESEFAFLKLLKEKTKPLIILLNIKHNLRDSRRLEHFLKNPDRWFSKEGKNGIGGHLNRIHRYAQEHYTNDYLPIIPVMLLAAQLAQEPEHKEYSQQLFKASRIQDFLDSIRVSLIDYGFIRRSQTLLGSTVSSINNPYQWISQQVTNYDSLVRNLKEKRQELKQNMEKTQEDYFNELQQDIKAICQDILNQVTPFAEKYWECNEYQLGSEWKDLLKKLNFENRLNTSIEKASQRFQQDVKEALEEIGDELRIISQLQGVDMKFSKYDSGFFDKGWIRITGMLLIAASVLGFLVPPLGLLSLAGGIVSLLSGIFKSRDQKRREAVQKIANSLKEQLQKQQEKIQKEATKSYNEYCQSVTSNVDKYFGELIQGIENISNQMRPTQKDLAKAEKYLNLAYAKRIIDWATDNHEPLSEISISKKIPRVDRDFGKSIKIQVTSPLSLIKSQEVISNILQETISISPIKN